MDAALMWIFGVVASVLASIMSGAVFWFSRSVKKLYDTVAMQAAINESLTDDMKKIHARVSHIESEMIGWTVLFRIERSLALLSQQGQGNEAMGIVAQVIRQEVDARKKA